MNVPFIDFTRQHQIIKEEVDRGFQEVIKRGDFILGKEEAAFEEAFSRYCGVRFAVGVNSGTDALYLALSAMDVGPGDEVILPAFTFIATALCVSYAGAKVVFADIEDETYNIDPRKLKKLITKKTKAIIPVHIYGQTASMDEIRALAREHGIKILEDAAQAHGALYKDKRAGSLGDAACFSFYPTKSLGAFGDGGMIVTDDKKIYDNALMLRDYGRTGRYEHKVKGYNSRLDTLQAVVLSAKLKHLDEWNRLRAGHAGTYMKHLKGIDQVKLPATQKDRNHIYQTFAVRISNRDKVCEVLKKKTIASLIHYPIPLHLQEAYKELGHRRGDFPVSEKIASEILSLPMFPHMQNEQIAYVAETLKAAVGEHARV